MAKAIPYPHQAMRRRWRGEFPGGELLVLEQAGLFLTHAFRDTVVPALLANTLDPPTDSRSRDVAG
ncbi:hypothetical protein BH23CHL2_BH23CHL2_31070 [soil metagenome]